MKGKIKLTFWAWLLIVAIASIAGLTTLGVFFGVLGIYIPIVTAIAIGIFFGNYKESKLNAIAATLAFICVSFIVFICGAAIKKESDKSIQCRQDRQFQNGEIIHMKNFQTKFIVEEIDCSNGTAFYDLLNEMGQHVKLHESKLEK